MRNAKSTSGLNNSRRLKRGFEKLEPRCLLAVVINEIHYDPDLNTEQVEFLELHNTDVDAVDLSHWRIDEAVDYEFPAGASIDAGGYLVIAQDAVEFQAKFGVAPFGQWEEGDKLSNDGETIELLDAASEVVDEVSYRPGFPWPSTGEHGSSLELIHHDLDNDLAGSWRSSGLASNASAGETLVMSGGVWSYRKGVTANPPSNPATPGQDWRLADFVESNDAVAWQDGAASIGYGDGDDTTVLSDMRNNYSTIYARYDFTLDGVIPDALELRAYVDDGAIVYINGEEVSRLYVSAGDKNYNSLTDVNDHEAAWESTLLTGASDYLIVGENTIAVHVLNSSLNSSDLSFNLELKVPDNTIGLPTPGARNSVWALNAAPQLRQLDQSVLQPQSGEDVIISIKATDPDGVESVQLEYQIVDPGGYVRVTDAAYDANWTSLAMHDDGLNGDELAGDDTYSAVLPGNLQTHRSLVRYRISAADTLGATVQAPYADDAQPNFAYFVYDGVPDYTASLRPGVEPNVVYSGDALAEISTYHFLANETDVINSQYNSQYNEVLFRGTLVYNGVVYDHVEFRNRGVASTYRVGKNKWKIEFLPGHHLQALDNYGNPYNELWDEINILPGTNPWWRDDVSTEGTVLFEPAAFKLYELAGAPSPHTTYFNFRVIDSASEVGSNQYDGDFWGLYIGIEQPDGSFLDERGLEDGNMYNMHGSVYGSTTKRHQGSESTTDRSDLSAFLSGIDGGYESLQWWEENLNWDVYFAWNIINHLVNNSDIRPNENVNYYRDQVSGQWYVLPWDLDLTFEDAPHHGNPVTNRENIRTLMEDHPLAKLAYENRLREITDLLLDNGDAALVVEELAGILTLGDDDLTIIQANQAMWDFHPRKNKKGIWYENFNSSLLDSETFAGLVDYMQDFVSPNGYGYDLVQSQGADANIPTTPTLTYVGAPEYSADQLTFETTPFSDPQGSATFANMQWRVAEVLNASVANYEAAQPYIYEIEGTWDSGELSTFSNQITLPEGAVSPDTTYRARVRMQDADGHWSHWSDSIEFLATASVALPTLAITELHYHPLNPDLANENDQEFIEILNTGDMQVDLSGVQIADFAAEPYVFQNGLTLAAGEYIVVARSPDTFQAVYGTGVNLAPLGYATSNLSNGGETISLRSSFGETILSFTYDDQDGWPEAADGTGPSLEIIDPLADPSDPANWRASELAGGSPGSAGLVTPILAGDYDNNGAVEQADYDVWRSQYGMELSTVGAGADGNHDGVVDAADFSVWRDNLGATAPAAAVMAQVISDPAAPAQTVASVAAVDEALEVDQAVAAESSDLTQRLGQLAATTADDHRLRRPVREANLARHDDGAEFALKTRRDHLLLQSQGDCDSDVDERERDEFFGHWGEEVANHEHADGSWRNVSAGRKLKAAFQS